MPIGDRANERIGDRIDARAYGTHGARVRGFQTQDLVVKQGKRARESAVGRLSGRAETIEEERAPLEHRHTRRQLTSGFCARSLRLEFGLRRLIMMPAVWCRNRLRRRLVE